jgi:hypothetical protein
MPKWILTDNEPGSRKLKPMLMLSEKQEMLSSTQQPDNHLQTMPKSTNDSRENSMPWTKKRKDSKVNLTDSKLSSRPRETNKLPTSKTEEKPLPVKRNNVPLKLKPEPLKTD